jgi:hypothetical protein
MRRRHAAQRLVRSYFCAICRARCWLRSISGRVLETSRRLSSSSNFSSKRSVTKRRRREFSIFNSLIWPISSRSAGSSTRSIPAASRGVGRAFAPRALRQRWYVMTLIPNSLAISRCSTPWAAIPSAVANLAAISDSVCLCRVTILPIRSSLWRLVSLVSCSHVMIRLRN